MGKPFKRKDTGKWEISFRDENGKRKRLSHFKTKAEALMEQSRIDVALQEGTYKTIDKNITLKQASDMYVRQYIDRHCKKSSKNGYEGYLNNHILPVFKDRKLFEIKKSEVEEFVITLVDKQLAPMTINHILHLFGAIFEKMIDDDIVKFNPVKRVKKLKIQRKKANALTAEQVEKCLTTAKIEYPQYYELLYTAIYSGLRQGELFALTWDDVDLEKKTIAVNKSYSKKELGETKTESSIRDIRTCPSLLKLLKEWKLKSKPNDKNLVFANEVGNYLDARNVLQRFLYPCLAKAKVKKVKWHELRHTHISLLLSQNVTPQVIQKQAGHSTIATTMDVYGHIMPSVYNSSIDELDNAFQNKAN
jgi:integrase